MVFEHQTLVQNRLTQANFAARRALDHEVTMNRALGQPETTRLESTTSRIARAGNDLVDAMLFVGEAPLTGPVRGSTDYATDFSARGPRDGRGRSLRDFDLARRMFKHPCSYLIYSEAFRELPPEMKDYVWKRLWHVLHGDDPSEKYAHLSADDRQAIVEILRETASDLPSFWNEAPTPSETPPPGE